MATKTRKLIVGIIAVIVGIGTSVVLDSFFREQIQSLFILSTSNHIRFTGKNFHLFSSYFYYSSFALAFLLFFLTNLGLEVKQIIKSGIISILLFTLAVVVISLIDANMKVIECTACNDGIRILHWNEINYDLILSTSILISMIPNILSLVRNLK